MRAGQKAKGCRGMFALAAVAAGVCLSPPGWAQATVKSQGITQQRINEFAAALDRAIRTIVDDSGLRQPREKLPVYLNRVSIPLPEESLPKYRARIEQYLRALEEARDKTVPLRSKPALSDVSPANQTVWERATQALRYFPARLDKLRGAWKREQSRGQSVQKSRLLGQEFYQTLELTLAARDGLRDARP